MAPVLSVQHAHSKPVVNQKPAPKRKFSEGVSDSCATLLVSSAKKARTDNSSAPEATLADILGEELKAASTPTATPRHASVSTALPTATKLVSVIEDAKKTMGQNIKDNSRSKLQCPDFRKIHEKNFKSQKSIAEVVNRVRQLSSLYCHLIILSV